MTFEPYLPRFSSARLCSWWQKRTNYSTSNALAIGMVRKWLQQGLGPSPKLAAKLQLHKESLLDQMCGDADPQVELGL